jgi:hypothetical protein
VIATATETSSAVAVAVAILTAVAIAVSITIPIPLPIAVAIANEVTRPISAEFTLLDMPSSGEMGTGINRREKEQGKEKKERKKHIGECDGDFCFETVMSPETFRYKHFVEYIQMYEKRNGST